MNRPLFLLPLAVVLAFSGASAQPVPLGGIVEDYARVLQVMGKTELPSMLVRPVYRDTIGAVSGTTGSWAAAVRPESVAGRFWEVSFYDPRLFLSWNSRRPSGENDGAVWQGRGATSALEGGVYFRAGPLSASLRPIVTYAQNRAFELSRFAPPAQHSEYAYPRDPIHGLFRDVPQRFGPDPVTRWDWGQSFVALEHFGARVGISNENMWWGPGLRGAISMTNNAPGFPHFFIGTSRPIDIYIGALEGRWIWGRLAESDYFDEDPDNDSRYITALTLAYSPRWVDGLSVGLGRVFYRIPPDQYRARDIFASVDLLFKVDSWFFERNEEGFYGSDEYDQLISLFGRWVFPESGVEMYAEWGRGDHALDIRDFILEPGHGRGYLVGFQKVFDLEPGRMLRTFVEVSSLEATKTWLTRRRSANATFFYTHGRAPQGYTQRGQVIGTWIGAGSSSQSLGVTLFEPWGRAGFVAERVAYNNDFYYNLNMGPLGHMVGLDFALDGALFWRTWGFEGGIAYERLLNEDWVIDADSTNWHLTMAVRYLIGS